MMQELNGANNPAFDCATVSEPTKSGTATTPTSSVQYSTSSIPTIPTIPTEAVVIPNVVVSPTGIPRGAAPNDYDKIPVTTEPPATYPPHSNGILAIIVTLLCGMINPCALFALKYSFESAKALHAYNYVKAKRDGILAKHCAIGGIILGALALSIYYYRGIVKGLHGNYNIDSEGREPDVRN